MSKNPAVESNNSDHKDGISDRQQDAKAFAFSLRLRARAEELGLKPAEIARLAGIKKQTMQGYWNGERLCGSDKLFALADILDLDARFLIEGQRPKRQHLVDANDADWIDVEEYDLRGLADDSRGPVVSTTPFRRDWLNRVLGQSTGLWLARLPADLARHELREGDLVFLRDAEPGEAQDGAVYIVRIWGHLTVARIDSMLMNRMGSVEGNVQDRAIAPRDIGTDDGQAILVARVLGAPLRRL